MISTHGVPLSSVASRPIGPPSRPPRTGPVLQPIPPRMPARRDHDVFRPQRASKADLSLSKNLNERFGPPQVSAVSVPLLLICAGPNVDRKNGTPLQHGARPALSRRLRDSPPQTNRQELYRWTRYDPTLSADDSSERKSEWKPGFRSGRDRRHFARRPAVVPPSLSFRRWPRRMAHLRSIWRRDRKRWPICVS